MMITIIVVDDVLSPIPLRWVNAVEKVLSIASGTGPSKKKRWVCVYANTYTCVHMCASMSQTIKPRLPASSRSFPHCGGWFQYSWWGSSLKKKPVKKHIYNACQSKHGSWCFHLLKNIYKVVLFLEKYHTLIEQSWEILWMYKDINLDHPQFFHPPRLNTTSQTRVDKPSTGILVS